MKPSNRALIPATDLALDAPFLMEQAGEHARNSRAKNTITAYKSVWKEFEGFCLSAKRAALPAEPETIVLYLEWLISDKRQRLHNDQQGARMRFRALRPSSLRVHLSAIAYAHKLKGLPNPAEHEAVVGVLGGIIRQLGMAADQKKPILLDDLNRMVRTLPDSLTGLRDRAILVIGFSGGFRRSELVALTCADVEFKPGEVTIRLRRSKTDQEGKGLVKHLPINAYALLCPVTTLMRWMEAAHLRSGPVFRRVDRWGKVGKKPMDSSHVARLVKSAAEAAGLDPQRVSGHSLRAGFVTQAALDREPEWAIQSVTGHKDVRVLRQYIRATGVEQADTIRRVMTPKRKKG